MTEPQVNQRAQQVLKILVERYIQEGYPVASKTIAEESTLGLSPATIRNILAELEENGYLTSLHTSSGRVPTHRGYRFFVNSLISVKPLESQEVQALKKQLDPELTMPDLFHCASTLLSDLTDFIGVVALPKKCSICLQQIQFLPLSSRGNYQRILVILVLSDQEIQNRVISCERLYTLSELEQAANYLNTHYAGKNLLDIRKELSEEIQNDRKNINQLIQAALTIANKAFETTEEKSNHYVIAGQENLFHHPHEINLLQLRNLFETFTQKQEIFSLLNQSIEAEGIQIFIGQESGHAALNDWSVITTPYSVNGKIMGGLGVIGPLRMPYDRIISVVDVTAKLLSAVLNQV